MIGNRDEFSVYAFAPDGSYKRPCQFVSAAVAVARALQLSHNASAFIGQTTRVIITDGGDCIAYEWLFGQGQVFPPVLESVP